MFKYKFVPDEWDERRAAEPPPSPPVESRALPGAWYEREFVIDNLIVRIHFIIVMTRWTGLAPWEFPSPPVESRALQASALRPVSFCITLEPRIE